MDDRRILPLYAYKYKIGYPCINFPLAIHMIKLTIPVFMDNEDNYGDTDVHISIYKRY